MVVGNSRKAEVELGGKRKGRKRRRGKGEREVEVGGRCPPLSSVIRRR